ncbi:MAG: hypothetical protein G01um10147_853 [Microgenomates group bacterium Gr01-1014_7]|nr:MAG: hypothetical protein G01um10147_853 [Microgenomates group bacterium Gr01-1014_7]
MYSRFTLPLAWILTFFVLLFIYTKFLGPIPFSVNSVTTTKSTTFDVTGEGKVIVKPDVAMVNVGVRTQSQTVDEAQTQMDSSINKVPQALKDLGVDPKDIQTTNYNINPDYDFSKGSQKIKGYTASTTLSVKVRSIDKVNSIIDAATANGANEVSGVSFDIDDKTKAQNEAREKAVAEAKKKAEEASKIAGFKLGKIINYSENFGEGPGPISLRAIGALGAEDTKTQVELGSSEITVTVTLSYEIQ